MSSVRRSEESQGTWKIWQRVLPSAAPGTADARPDELQRMHDTFRKRTIEKKKTKRKFLLRLLVRQGHVASEPNSMQINWNSIEVCFSPSSLKWFMIHFGFVSFSFSFNSFQIWSPAAELFFKWEDWSQAESLKSKRHQVRRLQMRRLNLTLRLL